MKLNYYLIPNFLFIMFLIFGIIGFVLWEEKLWAKSFIISLFCFIFSVVCGLLFMLCENKEET